ncbi:MAG: GNAT family N-acetyltransferase [Eubacteriales bacterium]|nr:GNAT family N-acetyltransferase [Eubacteriales bacterium]
MSVNLEKMSDNAYSQFMKISFEHQVEELIREENLSKEEAELETRKELDEMLPQGLETPDNYLYSIRHDEHVVGYLWFLSEMNEDVKQVFLCDFLIYEDERCKGYGKAALVEMEKLAQDLQCKECVLFVEGINENAKKLYLKCGYQVLREHNYGYFMKKSIA